MAELSTLARPYAKAVFEYADDANDLQGWSKSLALVAAVTQQDAVVRLLNSPNYTAAKKAEKTIAVCGDAINDKVCGFMRVLSENRRLKLLPQIYQQFEVLKANREKTIEVSVVSARAISSEQKNKLASVLSEKLERKVNMQVSVDDSLIGGVIVRAGDTVIDGSIRGRLAKLAEVLNS